MLWLCHTKIQSAKSAQKRNTQNLNCTVGNLGKFMSYIYRYTLWSEHLLPGKVATINLYSVLSPFFYVKNKYLISLQVMPEKPFLFWKRPLVPLCNKEVRIIVGEPLHFDVHSLKQTALSVSHKEEEEEGLRGWPALQPDGLQEVPQRWLYRTISHKIHCAMERLRTQIQHFFISF